MRKFYLFVYLTVFIFSINALEINLFAEQVPENSNSILRIGYQKFSNEIADIRYIQPFVQFIKNELPEHQIEFICLSDELLLKSVLWGELEFVICNPYIAVFAEHLTSYSPVATLTRKSPEGIVKHEAGVIFCKSDRTDINTLRDATNKNVCAPGRVFFTGWILPKNEFHKQGILPERDFSTIFFAGNHEEVLNTILAGGADVGCMGAFYLWKYIEKGRVKQNEIKIINPKQNPEVPFLHSTDVFPGVCFMAHPAISEEIKKKMLIALLKISPESPEATCLYSAGWIPHLSNESIEELVRKLRLPPFDVIQRVSFFELLKQYRYLILSFFIFWTLFLIAVFSLIYAYKMVKTNKLLEYSINHTKLARKELEESERRYRLLTENFPGTVYICKNDEHYSKLYLTEGVLSLTGYTNDEFISKRISFPDLYHPEDRDYIFNEVDAKLKQRIPFHLVYRIQHRDGSWMWLEEIGTGVWDDENLLYLQGYIWDITEKKKEEEKQREKNERLMVERDIITSITISPFVSEGDFEGLSRFITEEIGKKLKVPRVNVWLFNEDRNQLICIDHYDLYSALHSAGYILHEEEFYYEFQELKGAKYVDAYDALEDPRTKGYASNYLIPLDIKSMLDVGIRIGGENVGVICFEYTGEKHFWDDDEITFACQVADQLALIFTIRERLKTERHRDLLVQTVESTDEGILIADVNETVVYLNPAVEKITNRKKQDLLNKHLFTFFENCLSKDEYLKDFELLKGGKTVRKQLELVRGDKDVYTIEYSLFPLFNARKELTNIVLIFRDITNELKLLNDLKQAQKMESVGQLAGGIAHDLNNHLMVINGYAELAERELTSDSPIISYIQEIISANKKAGSLIRQLLAFARKQILKKEVVNVNELIQNTCKMLVRLLKENIDLSFIPYESLHLIKADRNAVEVIIINLCVNANDAMPNGGKLLIETNLTTLSEEMTKGISWVSPGDFVVISVTDMGMGMDKYTMEHCFDPFFTTKELGKGTGLGLSTVYGLVQQHGGIIHVYSELGKGTTFKVYLPIIEHEQIHESKEDEEEKQRAQFGGNETILIAEDEISVRSVAMRILEQAGYKVISAKDGEEAVKLILENISDIDLVILDVVMPIMGGKEVYEKIKSIRPNLPVLFSTGYSENSIHIDFVLKENYHLLNKPYGRLELLRAVRDILDKK